MEKKFDLVSMGEAVVEVFRKEVDVGMDVPGDFIGPYPSGAPAITVDTMAKLGGSCAYIATVGQDDFGTCVKQRLKKDGVDVIGITKLKNKMTGIAFTNYFSNGDRKFIYNFTTAATAYLTPALIDKRVILASRWLHVSGNVLAFSKSARDAVIKAVKVAHKHDIPISLDPNIRLEIMDKRKLYHLLKPILDRATVLLPSKGELNLIFGESKSDHEIIRTLLSGNVKTVVSKEGEAGSTAYTKEETVHADAFEGIDEVDPTGCGDAFCAGFIYGMLNRWGMMQTLKFANAVGAITATKKGAMEGVERLDEVKQFLSKRDIKIH